MFVEKITPDTTLRENDFQNMMNEGCEIQAYLRTT